MLLLPSGWKAMLEGGQFGNRKTLPHRSTGSAPAGGQGISGISEWSPMSQPSIGRVLFGGSKSGSRYEPHQRMRLMVGGVVATGQQLPPPARKQSMMARSMLLTWP